MIQRFGERLSRLAERWMPDPFILALLLTLTSAAAALAFTPARFADLFTYWRPVRGAGFWGFLEFAMQMCLVLVGGHAIATAPPVRRVLSAIARLPLSAGDAAALVGFCAMAAALVNWGLGLIVGAFLAREMGVAAARAGRPLHYPLLGAAGYCGLMNWHGGLSGSGPLDAAAAAAAPIPLAHSLGLPLNLVLNAALLVAVPLCLRAMAPRRPEEMTPAHLDPDPAPVAPAAAAASAVSGIPPTPARRLEDSPLWTLLFCGAAAWVVFRGVRDEGARWFNLYTVTFLFLFLGWALHGRTLSFVRAVEEGARGCGGILLQFPFYAGIAAIIQGSGLSDVLTEATKDAARTIAGLGLPLPAAFSLLVFGVACLLNIFIPSGGGQWKVQGPIVLAACAEMGVPAGKGVMLVAYGDELTNMVQPFWALALLGILGLPARAIMGYTTAVMLLVLPLYALCVALF